MHQLCFLCDLKQANKVSSLLSLSQDQQEQLTLLVQNELDHCDMSKTNPEIMKSIWTKITTFIQNNDPYKEVKRKYNDLLYSYRKEIKDTIGTNLTSAIQADIIANIIDFSAKDSILIDKVLEDLKHASSKTLQVDHTKQLIQDISNAKKIVILADNCGEIVLDSILIEMILTQDPAKEIIYIVKDQPIVNDVTLEDCKQAGLDQICKCISNGDYSLGTVYPLVSSKCKEVIDHADLIISKGQGNFEGMIDQHFNHIYYLMMVKCQIVANMTNTKVNDLICMKGY